MTFEERLQLWRECNCNLERYLAALPADEPRETPDGFPVGDKPAILHAGEETLVKLNRCRWCTRPEPVCLADPCAVRWRKGRSPR